MQKLSLPKLLSEIPDAPKQLYIRGNFPNQEHAIFLAVVGSRKYSSYGQQVCSNIIKGLAGYPFVIVSGLALGIDSIAHEQALKVKLRTIAIPGSGLNDKVLYPASNRQLARRILKSGGCLVSEYEPDFKATSWSFPKRNRIMAGLCHAVLVIEAENISGTRITARLATEYNREVFAVPGSILNKQSQGCHKLIQEGAVAITSAQDILEYFNIKSQMQHSFEVKNLSKDEERIVNLLAEEQSRTELSHKLNLPSHELSILLSKLEIKGIVSERLGKIYKNF